MGFASARRAELPDAELLQTTRIPLLLRPLNALHLKMNEEPLPDEMTLLSRTGTKDQPRTENINTHGAQPESPTHQRRQPGHQTYFFYFFHHLFL